MLQNIGQVVSKEATGPVETAVTCRPLDAMPEAVGRLWKNSSERSGAPHTHRPGVDVRPLPHPQAVFERELLRAEDQSGLTLSWEGDRPVVLHPTPTRTAALGVKRAMDLSLAMAVILVFAPVFILAALAIKLSSKGPVLFAQNRVGFMNEEFRVYKFRTMFVDNQDVSGVTQTTAQDARITPVGRILRRTSVDELPQIINIFKGEMSFVGPRPHVAGMLAGGLPYEELVPYYDLRHRMKPGLTGWAQANGFRGPTVDPITARARVDHDIAYIQNFSLGLDLLILVKTAWREFITGTGI